MLGFESLFLHFLAISLYAILTLLHFLMRLFETCSVFPVFDPFFFSAYRRSSYRPQGRIFFFYKKKKFFERGERPQGPFSIFFFFRPFYAF